MVREGGGQGEGAEGGGVGVGGGGISNSSEATISSSSHIKTKKLGDNLRDKIQFKGLNHNNITMSPEYS